jgi:uncharacterized protein YceK
MIKFKTMIFIVMIIMMSGCSLSSVSTGPKDKEIFAGLGQQIVITMETDWISQTRWVIDSYDEDKIEILSVSHWNYSGQQGSESCRDIFVLKTLSAGDSEIKFKLEKYWGLGNFKQDIKVIHTR